jgi:DnaJ homologue, subfamily C, member 28, conserved domain
VPIRRDGEGKPAVGPTWESLAERLIREAMERGEFDDLPYKGERLPMDDDTYAGDNALAFQVLRNAGAAPPWIEADKEARRQIDSRDRLLERARHAATEIARERLRSELPAIVTAANAAIDRLNTEAPNVTLHRRRLDLRVEAERLEAAFDPPSGLR